MLMPPQTQNYVVKVQQMIRLGLQRDFMPNEKINEHCRCKHTISLPTVTSFSLLVLRLGLHTFIDLDFMNTITVPHSVLGVVSLVLENSFSELFPLSSSFAPHLFLQICFLTGSYMRRSILSCMCMELELKAD